MATDYDALVRELGGDISTDKAGGMTVDAQGRPVLRVEIGGARPPRLEGVSTAPTGSAGAPPIPVTTVDISPSDYAAIASEFGGDVSVEEQPDASAGMIPATFSKGIVKGVAGLPDLLAQGLGYGAGSIADVLGAPEDVVQGLKNPFTIGGALDVLQPTARNQEGFERTGEGVGGALSGVGLGGLLAKSAAPSISILGERMAKFDAPSISILGERMAKSAAPVTAAIGNVLAEQPVLQSIAGGTGGLSAYVADRLGAGPVGQTIAGLLGGFAPVAAAPAIATGTRALFSPLSSDAPRRGAAALLQQNASDPRAAARNIRAAMDENKLTGVVPTTAELARDPGIAGLQRGLSNIANPAAAAMGDRQQANMLARAKAIDEAAGAGDPEALLQAAIVRQRALDAAALASGERVGALNPADVSGEALRKQLAEQAARAKAFAREKYRAVPEDVEPIQIGAVEPNDMRGVGEIDQGRVSFEAEAKAAMGAPGSLSRAGFETAPSQPSETLLGWIRKSGGIVRDGREAADLAAMGITPKTMPGLFNNNRGSFTKGAARSELGRKGNRLDDLTTRMIEDGWLPEGSSLNDALDLIGTDWRSMGQRGVSRAKRVSGEDFEPEAATADDITEYWSRELSNRDLDPGTMRAEDWDAFYRDMGGPPLPIGKDDIAFLGEGADRAAGRTELSPFQASLMTLRRKFFPGAGLPEDKSVSVLMRQLENADVLEARQVERIVEDLRKQAGFLKMSDPRSGALARAAADATEGLLQSQAGPARAQALKEARSAYRDYKTTFAEDEPGRILAESKFGRETLDPARIPGVAVPGNVTGGTATRRLAQAAGPEAAEQAAREELRRALDPIANDSAKIGALEKRYGPVLAEYPALASEIAAVRDAAAMAEAFAVSPLGRLRTSNLSPSESVAMAVRAKDNGKALRNISGAVRNNPDAQSGLRRALVEFVLPSDLKGAMTASGDVVTSPLRTMENLNAVLTKTQGTGLFTPDQTKVLNEVQRQLKALRFANTAASVSGSTTALNQGLLARRVSQLALDSAAPGVGRGVKALNFLIDAIADPEEAVALARQAMLDPKLAVELLEKATPNRLELLAKKIGAVGRGSFFGTTAAVESDDNGGLSTMPGGVN